MAGQGRHRADRPSPETRGDHGGARRVPLHRASAPAVHWLMDGDPVVATRDGAEPPGPEDLAAQLDDLERHRSLNVGARLYRARVLETEARATGAVVPLMRARLVQADMLHRVGDAATAAELAVEVNAWAAERGPRSLLARSHLVLSSVFEGIGDAASALDHAVRALEMLGDDVPGRERGTYVLRLADALALTGSPEESLERYHVAEALFLAAGDTERRRVALNNRAMLHFENGELDEALAVVAPPPPPARPPRPAARTG